MEVRGMSGGGEVKTKEGCTWVVGNKKERKKKKENEEMVYVGGEKKKRKKKEKNNNIMIKTKSKNQNYVPNIIFYFLNCDFSCETKTMYQIEFFLQS